MRKEGFGVIHIKRNSFVLKTHPRKRSSKHTTEKNKLHQLIKLDCPLIIRAIWANECPKPPAILNGRIVGKKLKKENMTSKINVHIKKRLLQDSGNWEKYLKNNASCKVKIYKRHGFIPIDQRWEWCGRYRDKRKTY